MKVTFDHSKPAAQNIITFYFKPDREVRYQAGQFIELRLPHDNKDSRGDKRWFTLSSSPSEDLLSITTKFTVEDGSSFKNTLRSLQPGTVVDMASPMGDFVLPKDASIPLVFVAGGIGCTPFHSMVSSLQGSGEDRNVLLLYAANNEQEVAFKDTFGKLGPRLQMIIGERLDADKILELAGERPDQYIYLSGPEPMVEALEKGLKAAGVNKKHIRTDFFPGYTAI